MTGPVARPGIKDVPLYVPGEHKVPGGIEPVVLSANENPLGPSPKAAEAYKAAAAELNRYPDGSAKVLRTAIAKRYGLEAERIVCGAGSDELITMIVRAFAGPGDEVLYSQHGFLMYAISAMTVGAVPKTAPETDLTTDVDALLAAVTDRTRIVFVANPNNPTGSYIPASELERLADSLPEGVLLVVDAAYAEYVGKNDYASGMELAASRPNVVMTRTFSKIHGLAAIRLGWCYGPAEIVDVLHRLRSPFNVNSAAQAAGVAAIEDTAHVDRSREHNDRELERLTKGLKALGLEVPPSVGNFLLAGFADQAQADAAYDHMLTRGVICRKMGGYGLPRYIRITVGLESEVDRLLEALKEFTG